MLGMDKTTGRAVLAQLTAQTELLGVLARYYAGITESDFVRAIPVRNLDELRNADPEAAALAERIGARSEPKLSRDTT